VSGGGSVCGGVLGRWEKVGRGGWGVKIGQK